jgi:hypothetical protein
MAHDSTLVKRSQLLPVSIRNVRTDGMRGAGLMEAEKKFRRLKGYPELPELARKLNPALHSQQQVA